MTMKTKNQLHHVAPDMADLAEVWRWMVIMALAGTALLLWLRQMH